jgi:hypothetical protein
MNLAKDNFCILIGSLPVDILQLNVSKIGMRTQYNLQLLIIKSKILPVPIPTQLIHSTSVVDPDL